MYQVGKKKFILSYDFLPEESFIVPIVIQIDAVRIHSRLWEPRYTKDGITWNVIANVFPKTKHEAIGFLIDMFNNEFSFMQLLTKLNVSLVNLPDHPGIIEDVEHLK